MAIEYLDGQPSPPGPLGASATMRSRSLGVAHTELPPLYRISQPLPKISLAICPLVATRVFSSQLPQMKAGGYCISVSSGVGAGINVRLYGILNSDLVFSTLRYEWASPRAAAEGRN